MIFNTTFTTRKLFMILVLVAVVALPVELFSFFAGKLLANKGLLYFPEKIESYTSYLQNRDPVLGWPSKIELNHGEFDQSGSRIVPSYPDTSLPSCAALYGDSFTWGQEVDPEHAYGNVLAGLMGCRVANYGVPGYGTDQAYLRYERVIKDNAPIVILGHYSENIIRNVNQNRGFLTNQPIGLKPRFILEANKLKLIPLPNLTEAENLNLISSAHDILPYDYFAPGGLSGLHSLKFPYTLSTIGAFQHYRLQAKIMGKVTYAKFYEPTHPSQALQVTEAIIKSFVNEAHSRNQNPLVLLIPDIKEIRWLRDHGTLPYAELATRLRMSGVEVIDVAVELNKIAGTQDPGKFYGHDGTGHLNQEGYKQLANIIFNKLKELEWAIKQ
jgi:lysophospholipase L1-like esterase